jgi:hypothetical protein
VEKASGEVALEAAKAFALGMMNGGEFVKRLVRRSTVPQPMFPRLAKAPG